MVGKKSIVRIYSYYGSFILYTKNHNSKLDGILIICYALLISFIDITTFYIFTIFTALIVLYKFELFEFL